ncbi:MAG: CpaF/VirB11 family protein [Clostridiales Family XIII bacterium]|jgi:pilus assembly protein CpaF|nr:CpaF/VirB11 family protein [Clostridiales Family XIII bacterium]
MLGLDAACRLVEPLVEADPAAQKRAIVGVPEDVARFRARICGALEAQGLRGQVAVPAWYESEEEAIFEEVWGRAGLAEWWKPPYDASPSAKVIGEDVYFLVDGRMRRMPQKIGRHRREQLVRAILLLTPEERLDRDFHEVYLLDGTRVTVFKGALAKADRDVIVLRRYVVPEYTLEEQAARGTIPAEAIPLFRAMVRVGYNVVFCGSVRSAKTTFLSTWQRLEDPALEGVMVETDPEIPLHRLMPGAPVVQLVCDGERLAAVSRNLLRSDADYFVLAEARDGVALDMAVRVARKGTGRMKMTYHTRDPLSFPEDAAVEIVRSCGGDVGETARRVAGSFDYLFHFCALAGGRKLLRGVYEVGVRDGAPYVEAICLYDFAGGRWVWTARISEGKRRRGAESDPEGFAAFERELAKLAATTLSPPDSFRGSGGNDTVSVGAGR